MIPRVGGRSKLGRGGNAAFEFEGGIGQDSGLQQQMECAMNLADGLKVFAGRSNPLFTQKVCEHINSPVG
jgi:hypothetical protein